MSHWSNMGFLKSNICVQLPQTQTHYLQRQKKKTTTNQKHLIWCNCETIPQIYISLCFSLFTEGQLCSLSVVENCLCPCVFLSIRPDQMLHIRRSTIISQRGGKWKTVYISVCWYYLFIQRDVNIQVLKTNQYNGKGNDGYHRLLFVPVYLWN